MIRTIGLIGAGNMGSAIFRGIVDAGYVKPEQLTVYDVSKRKLRELSEDIPGLYASADVIGGLRPALRGKAVLSIAAGWTVDMLEKALEGTGATWLRVMPNTPALVGEGMTALCDDTTFSQEDFDFCKGIFDAIGKTKILPERLFDGVTAISGSSPAYVYMMIEAMADAGVREGLPRACAYEMARGAEG